MSIRERGLSRFEPRVLLGWSNSVNLWVIVQPNHRRTDLFVYFLHRFRAGFKQAFHCCPCVPQGSYEGLELKSTRYLQTQTSVYKASRMETTVSTILQVGDDVEQPKVKVIGGPGPGGAVVEARPHSSSLDLTSNGSSSWSVSKTVSEMSSFYSSSNLEE